MRVLKKASETDKLLHGNKIIFLIGEAGCGKTTTLLALLFKYTGKHVSYKKLKKVVFFIPREKVHFRKDVMKFILENCRGEWAQLCPLSFLQKETLSTDTVYLIDEFYGSAPALIRNFRHLNTSVYIATISTKSEYGIFVSNVGFSCENVFLRRVYRSPEIVARVTSKLRRLIDRNEDSNAQMNIPWAMSFFNGLPVSSKNFIRILSYDHCISPVIGSINVKLKERNLLVSLKIEPITLQLVEQLLSHCTIEQIFHDAQSVHDLSFTGSEFASVIVLLGDNVDVKSEFILLLLYCAISRATENVYVICHHRMSDEIHSLLALSRSTDVIFEKVRSSTNMGSGIVEDLKDPKDRLEFLKRILVTRNEHQFKAFRSEFSEDKMSTEELLLALSNEIMNIFHSHQNPLPIVEHLILTHSLSRAETFGISEIRQFWHSLSCYDIYFAEDDKNELRWPNKSIFKISLQKLYSVEPVTI